MKAIDNEEKTLKEVVEELTNLDHPLEGKPLLRRENNYLKERDDEFFTKQVLVQRLRGELRKYLSRPDIYEEQVSFIREKINEIEKA